MATFDFLGIELCLSEPSREFVVLRSCDYVRRKFHRAYFMR